MVALLATYGITAATLTELTATINAFNDYIPEPRVNITERKGATEGIADMVTQSDVILGKIDVLVEMIENSFPAFYKRYFNNRKIINTGSRALALKVFVGTVDGVALEKVQVSIAGVSLVRKTTKKGNIQYKHLSNGIHKISFRLSGYVDKVMDVAIVEGLRTDISVVMEEVLVET